MRKRLTAVAVTLCTMGLVAACGADGPTVVNTLPVMIAVTTTTVPPTSTLAPDTEYQMYLVQSGDSVSYIASQFNVSVVDIVALNGLADADDIQAGQKLKIPAGAVSPVSSVASGPSTTSAP
ncbi:MAG: LysM peptidoglycan-binding domain-containing protein [Ilumatobacteraceae bacterium]|nr:LysM peptidoglycan-binding domain-containing protein [Ilumatobacteraceae bacterium]